MSAVKGMRSATMESLATGNTSPAMAGSTVQGARKRPTAVSNYPSIKFWGGYISKYRVTLLPLC